GKAFDEIDLNEHFGASLTVTELHIGMGAGMFGDFNPLHVNEQFSKNTRFGTRILPGPLTAALMSAPLGNYFAGTVVAYLEHNCRFIAPVRAMDTLTTTWTIEEKIVKPKHEGGIAIMCASCINQNGELVAEAKGKILLLNRVATTI
ncbi:MAG: MaoC/PaaZ C-terminal domain-containing protein, partial [Oceanospirillaceae bacterium]|nr:MaoC/PaaZ C-terminal domain-containing protein [Oceanospirillaceae bacterium]